jgi:hypothetical protein
VLRRSLEESIRRMDDAIARGRDARPYDDRYDPRYDRRDDPRYDPRDDDGRYEPEYQPR